MTVMEQELISAMERVRERLEYRRLLAAIRDDSPADEIQRVAAVVGLPADDLRELVALATRARADRPLAAEWPAFLKSWTKLHADLTAAEDALRLAATTEDQERAAAVVAELRERETRELSRWANLKLAHETCSLAAEQGVAKPL